MRSLRVACTSLALLLTACASPNIVIKPAVSVPASTAVAGMSRNVRLDIVGGEAAQGSRFEEKSDKARLGRSDSLGVHLSDIWIEDPPASFVRRLLEADLKAFGHSVGTNPEYFLVHGQVKRLSLDSKAANLLEFQADGVIEADVDISRPGAAPHYRGHYLATCTFRTATSVPNKENMEKLFNQCVEQFQRQVMDDAKLRAALASE